VDETGSGPCPIAGLGINSIELLNSTNRELVEISRSTHRGKDKCTHLLLKTLREETSGTSRCKWWDNTEMDNCETEHQGSRVDSTEFNHRPL
jgi:hypothetical protein